MARAAERDVRATMTSLLAPKRNGHNFTAGGFVVGAVSGIVAAASVYPASFLLMAFFISSTRVELSQNLLRGAALFPMVFIPALIVSSAHMLLLGVPLILLMEHFRILKLWSNKVGEISPFRAGLAAHAAV